MFDREAYREVHKQIFPNSKEEETEKYLDDMERKHSTLKEGDNVVHLTYYGGVINDNDVAELESILAKSNLELSRFDKSSTIQASLVDFMLQTAVYLKPEVTKNIIIGLAGSAIWDTIKSTVIYVWKKAKAKPFYNKTSSGFEPKPISFGIHVKLDENNSFDFKLEGDVSEEICLKSLDKALDFLKNVNTSQETKPTDFVRFNKETGDWEIVDVMAEIQKNAKKNRNKNG